MLEDKVKISIKKTNKNHRALINSKYSISPNLFQLKKLNRNHIKKKYRINQNSSYNKFPFNKIEKINIKAYLI